MKPTAVHALDPFAGRLAAVCRARVTITSEVSKDSAQITCEACHEQLTCPGCGWPVPISSAAALAAGRRYHVACASGLEMDAPSR